MAGTCDIDKCGSSASETQHHGEPSDPTSMPRWIAVNVCRAHAARMLDIRIDAKGGKLIKAWIA